MRFEIEDSVCEHEWVEGNDPAAYNDGLNCPRLYCDLCGAQKDISNKYDDENNLKWYEILLMPFFFMMIAPIIIIIEIIFFILIIKEELFSRKNC